MPVLRYIPGFAPDTTSGAARRDESGEIVPLSDLGGLFPIGIMECCIALLLTLNENKHFTSSEGLCDYKGPTSGLKRRIPGRRGPIQDQKGPSEYWHPSENKMDVNRSVFSFLEGACSARGPILNLISPTPLSRTPAAPLDITGALLQLKNSPECPAGTRQPRQVLTAWRTPGPVCNLCVCDTWGPLGSVTPLTV